MPQNGTREGYLSYIKATTCESCKTYETFVMFGAIIDG